MFVTFKKCFFNIYTFNVHLDNPFNPKLYTSQHLTNIIQFKIHKAGFIVHRFSMEENMKNTMAIIFI